MIRLRDVGAPDRLGFTADGLLFATRPGAGGVRWWDWSAGRVARLLPGSIAGTSPDGGFVALYVALGRRCRVVRGADAEPVGEFELLPFGGPVAVAPDGTEAAVAGVSQLAVYPLPDGPARTWPRRRPTGGVAYSPNGRWVFGPAGRTAVFLDRALPALDPVRVPAADRAAGLAVAPDDRTAAVVGRAVNTVVLFDLDAGAELGRLKGHRSSVLAVAFAPDGRRVLTGGRDGTVRVWDRESGDVVRVFDWKLGPVARVAWAPDRVTGAALGGSGQVVVWDVDD
jgi:hypothetical protein